MSLNLEKGLFRRERYFAGDFSFCCFLVEPNLRHSSCKNTGVQNSAFRKETGKQQGMSILGFKGMTPEEQPVSAAVGCSPREVDLCTTRLGANWEIGRK